MHANDLLIDHSYDLHGIEAFREDLPKFDAVATLA